MLKLVKYLLGIIIKPSTTDSAQDTSKQAEGAIWVSDTAGDNRIKSYLDSADREVITDDQVQVLSNKSTSDDFTVGGTLKADIIDTETPAGNLAINADTTITGDLTVTGTTTTIDSASVLITDANIVLNDTGDDASSEGAGLTIERTGVDGSIVYEDALASKFKAGAVGSEKEIVDVSSAQTITNKSIDADSNTITNIDNADIKAAAGIDAAKLADGSVSNTELQYINSLSSNAQTQITANATNIAAHENGGANKHDASEIDVEAADGGNHAAADLETVVGTLDDAITTAQSTADTNATNHTNHLNDTADAHDASAISVLDTGAVFTATDVEAALNEVKVIADTNATDIGTNDTDISNLQTFDTNLGLTTNGNGASQIGIEDAGAQYTSTNVEGALTESLDAAQAAQIGVNSVTSDLADHLDANPNKHNASLINVTLTGTHYTANHVELALSSLDAAIVNNDSKQDPVSGTANEIDVTADVIGLSDNPVIPGLDAMVIPKGTTAQGTNTTDGAFRFNTTENRFEGYKDGAFSEIGGAGGGSSISITQASHGLAVRDAIYSNSGVWTKAQANAGSTLAQYVVSEVSDVDNFVAVKFGQITDTAHGLTVGQHYFLSEITAGLATVTEPTVGYSAPLFYVEDVNTLLINVYRPSGIATTANLNDLGDVAAAAPSNGEVISYNSVSGDWEASAPSAGGLDLVYSENFESNTPSSIYSINGAPTTDAIVLNNTTTEMSGTQSAKVSIVTNNQGSLITLDDTVGHDGTSGAIATQPNTLDTLLGLHTKYLYDGNYGDIDLVVEESSDNTTFTENARMTLKVATSAKLAQLNFKLASASTHYRFYFDIVLENNGKTLEWDNVYVSDKPDQTKSEIESESGQWDTVAGYGSVATEIPYYTEERKNTLSELGTITNDSTNGFAFTASSKCKVSMTLNALYTAGTNIGISLNGVVTTALASLTPSQIKSFSTTTSSASSESVSCEIEMEVGDILRPHGQATPVSNAGLWSIQVTATALSNNIVFEGESNGSETITYTGQLSKSGNNVRYKTLDVDTSNDLITLDNSTYTKITFNKSCNVTASATVRLSSATTSATAIILYNSSSTVLRRVVAEDSATNIQSSVSLSEKVSVGDYILVTATGTVDTGNDTYSSFSVTASHIKSSTILSVPVTNEVENTYSARIANNGTATITSESSPFIESVTRSALGVVDVVFKTGFFGVIPSTSIAGEGVNESWITNEVTTGHTISTANAAGSKADKGFNITVTRQGSDYKAPRGYFLGNMAPVQVAYVKDVKTNGTAGGASVAGDQIRDLNDLSGDTDFISINGTDSFTLEAGKYTIEASAPAQQVNSHRLFLYNFTDSTEDILGNTSRNASGVGTQTNALLSGTVTITTSKTFEIKHYTETVRASDGLGTVCADSRDEVYTVVKITKLR